MYWVNSSTSFYPLTSVNRFYYFLQRDVSLSTRYNHAVRKQTSADWSYTTVCRIPAFQSSPFPRVYEFFRETPMQRRLLDGTRSSVNDRLRINM